ncbi:MAG: glycosyltransferase family 4 protein [Acidobacteria bacterium]|nr:glycosyltransferase family 4 protein [Acidobacteriota bacterium]MBI3426208.1 glycosyltransferase family 4 protein [Acidobacteriota bacterium]
MRIAQIATLGTPVSQTNSGSIESLVWVLTRELRRLGHEVTVFAAAGSEVEGELVATLPGPYATNGAPDDWQLCEWINLCAAVEQSARFEVLHSHAYLWGMPMQRLASAPFVHTHHMWPHDNEARLWAMTPDACVTGVSRYQWSEFPVLQPAAIVHHGVDVAQFSFQPEPQDYVCYLGRFTHGKGPLHAIEAARKLGLRLVLAGPEDNYYREYLAPLVDGRKVEFVGPVGGSARDELLGGARALLYPVQAPEPFGLVMVEAMLCGTPVAALRLGAVPEIIREGVTGCSAATLADYPQAMLNALTLDRAEVRRQAAAAFSAERMAREYAQVYERLARR